MYCRIVEVTVDTRVFYDDGPGSFRHVDQREARRVIEEWLMEDSATKDQMIAEAYYFCHHSEVEELVLEKLSDTPDNWQFVAYL